jgi:hypothetical protein
MSAPGYSRLFGYVGTTFIVVGGLFLLAFVAFLTIGASGVPTNAVGHYFVAFAASATIGWGWGLRAAAHDAGLRRVLAAPTAGAMVLMGLYRVVIVAASPEVRAWAGLVPVGEAVAFAALAIAFARTRQG